MEELLLGQNITTEKEKTRKRINYLLNVLTEDDLEYIFTIINDFIKYKHKEDVVTLKDIKDKIKHNK